MATPTVVFAFSVLNLLLCVGGLLFVYFDWNAARRREYLYLYFTDEKPKHDYFSAARLRRAQYTRLIAAFSVLSLRQFLSVMLASTVSQPGDWQAWLTWWNGGPSNPNISAAIAIQPWLGVLEAVGLALLGYALLHEWKNRRGEISPLPLLILAAAAAIWGVLVLCYSVNLFGKNGQAVVQWATILSRVAILAFLIAALRSRAEEKAPLGLFVLPASTVSIALGVWLVVPTIGDMLKWPAAYPLALFVSFLLLVGSLARGTLNDYESMELSRHRLGRERGVIFSFLKRLGAAFTTDVEVDQILRIILESALDTTEAAAGAIYLVNTKTNTLEPRVVLNFFPPMYVEAKSLPSERRTEELEEEMRHQSFVMGQGVIGEVGKSGRAQLIGDVRAAGIMLGTTTEYMRNRSMLVVPLRVRDETLGVMAVLNKQRGSFGGEDESLLQALADQASLSINNAMLTVEVAEQERLKRDLQIARDIQQKLLPKSCPRVPGFEISAVGLPAYDVGGDYYDFFWVDEDHLGIVVADVSGKGVSAALVVAMLRAAFRMQAPGNPDVRDVLTKVNSFIMQDMRRDMFVTCVYGILEISTRKWSWARAGHEPILVSHPQGKTEQLEPFGFAIGAVDSDLFRENLEVETIELHSGDNLLLFTDGLTEAMNEQKEEFGMENIVKSLENPYPSVNGHAELSERAQSCEPVGEESRGMRTLEDAVNNHVGNAEQSDDLTIVFLSAK